MVDGPPFAMSTKRYNLGNLMGPRIVRLIERISSH